MGGARLLVAATALVGWVLAGGDSSPLEAVTDWLPISTASASAAPRAASQIEIASDPPGATVLIDGRKQGQTPLSIGVVEGSHTVRLTHADTVDYERQVNVNGATRLDISMFRRRPI